MDEEKQQEKQEDSKEGEAEQSVSLEGEGVDEAVKEANEPDTE